MKAILTSSDITEVPGGVELAEEMTGKTRDQINIAVIIEASATEFKSHRWAIKELAKMTQTFGGSIEIVNLLLLPPGKIHERLFATDAIFVMGGRPELLKAIFDKTGVTEMIPEILNEKLWIGGSGGSMILGRQPFYSSQVDVYGARSDTEYLNILDFAILPHYKNKRGLREENWAIEESKKVDYPVYALSDTAAIVVDGEKIYFIGSEYAKIINGEVVK